MRPPYRDEKIEGVRVERYGKPYLTDFGNAVAQTATPAELYLAMLSKHERRANPGSVWGAAKRFKAA